MVKYGAKGYMRSKKVTDTAKDGSGGLTGVLGLYKEKESKAKSKRQM